MAELGDTSDPRELIPGDPAAIGENVTAIRGRGDAFEQAATGLRGIDTGDVWRGAAADRFREVFEPQPRRWFAAADAFTAAAAALDSYSHTLAWAQSQAGSAIRLWDEAQAATARAVAEHNQAIAEADTLNTANAAAGSNTRIEVAPFIDPGDEGRAHARAVLDEARRQVAEMGSRPRRRSAPPPRTLLSVRMSGTNCGTGVPR